MSVWGCMLVHMPIGARKKVLWMLWRAGVTSACEPPSVEFESSIRTVCTLNSWVNLLISLLLIFEQIVFGYENYPEVYLLFTVIRYPAYS